MAQTLSKAETLSRFGSWSFHIRSCGFTPLLLGRSEKFAICGLLTPASALRETGGIEAKRGASRFQSWGKQMNSRLAAGYRAIFLCLIFAAIAGAQAPDAPVLLSPLNGATGVSTAAALVWSAANNAASYDVYFGPSYPPPFVTNTTGISYDPGTLGASPKYYWQVVARNAAGTTSSGLFSFTTLPAVVLPFAQQGGKLVDTSAVNLPYQGWSVALSADGNTAIVGGPCDNGYFEPVNIRSNPPSFFYYCGPGAVWVFTRSEGAWTQQGGKLVYGGSSVALSADGNTALVGGAPVLAYTRSGGVWNQQGNPLAGGPAAALSADGNTALVGGNGGGMVFTRSEGVWTQLGGQLVGAGAVGNAGQGTSVAISGDGNTIILGGPDDNQTCVGYPCNSAGAAWVFTVPQEHPLRPHRP